MSFGVSVCKGYLDDKSNSHEDGEKCFRVLSCYTPTHESFTTQVVSLVKHPSQPKCAVNNQSLASIPSGAIVDMIEYSGLRSFSAKGGFTIGIGEMNNTIMVPLIENGTSLIANENVGGCRQFLSESETGENTKIKIPYKSCVNFTCDGGVQSGSLRVDIYYHIKQ